MQQRAHLRRRSGWITLSGTLRFGATAREINARCAIFLQNPALAYRGEAYLTKRRKGLVCMRIWFYV
jgi:hypothetical protein